MPEDLQDARIEDAAPAAVLPSPEIAAAAPPNLLRLAYAFEYLIALNVALAVWAQVGGQGHMDLLPWYIKLAGINAVSWCAVHFTSALVESPRIWTRRSRIWFAGILLMAALLGSITFYYHLHEATDEQDSDETTATSVMLAMPGRLVRQA